METLGEMKVKKFFVDETSSSISQAVYENYLGLRLTHRAEMIVESVVNVNAFCKNIHQRTHKAYGGVSTAFVKYILNSL